MQLPRTVFSHCLAYGPDFSPELLRARLVHSQTMGFGGMITVPAIIPSTFTPEEVADIFTEVGMQGLVCGFNPGNGPDPLSDNYPKVLDSLRSQALYATALTDAGVGPAMMVGPMHTHHMTQRPVWPGDEFCRWIDELDQLAEELEIMLALEPLNSTEDGTPDPFEILSTILGGRSVLGLHIGETEKVSVTHVTENLLTSFTFVGQMKTARNGFRRRR